MWSLFLNTPKGQKYLVTSKSCLTMGIIQCCVFVRSDICRLRSISNIFCQGHFFFKLNPALLLTCDVLCWIFWHRKPTHRWHIPAICVPADLCEAISWNVYYISWHNNINTATIVRKLHPKYGSVTSTLQKILNELQHRFPHPFGQTPVVKLHMSIDKAGIVYRGCLF